MGGNLAIICDSIKARTKNISLMFLELTEVVSSTSLSGLLEEITYCYEILLDLNNFILDFSWGGSGKF